MGLLAELYPKWIALRIHFRVTNRTSFATGTQIWTLY